MKTIKDIVVHSRAHLEEFLITYLFARFGKKAGYKIIKNFSFKENYIGAFGNCNRTLESWADSGILPVGTLGGALDEHAQGSGNRKEEGSAVALASKILFKNKPLSGVRKIIEFSSDEDKKAGMGEYNLAYVVKIIQATEGMTNERLYKWLSFFFDAEHDISWKRFRVEQNSNLIKGLFERYKTENPKVNMAKFRRFMTDRNDPAKLDNYNISVVVNKLAAWGVPFEEIYPWVKLFFDAEMYRQDVLWPKTQSLAAKNLEMITSSNGPKVAFFESDEEVAHMAARVVAKPDLVIIKRSSGHVQMFASSKGYGKPAIVMMDKVVRALRVAEGSKGSDAELVSENFEGSPWYYHVIAQSVFNGSHSAPMVPTTELSVEDIKSLVSSNIYYRPGQSKPESTFKVAPAFKGVKVDKKGKIKKIS